jgi:hypothetical protein
MKSFIFAALLLSAAMAVFASSGTRVIEIPTLEHCALVANPASYDGKEIRLRGVYAACGKGDSKFFSSSCADKSILVEFEPRYESCSKPGAVRALHSVIDKSGARMKPHSSVLVLTYRAADVEFVGHFSASNPYRNEELPTPKDSPFGPIASNRAGYAFVFRVSCVERVKPLPKNANY